MGAGESSNNNNVTGPVPIRVRNANPLLYTLAQDHMNIQPYWIMILELIFKDFIFQRIWNRWRYKTWFTTQEIAFYFLFVLREGDQERNTTVQKQFETSLKQSAANREPTNLHNVEITDTVSRLSVRDQKGLELYIEESKEKRSSYYSKKMRFDIFDIIFNCLPLSGHAICTVYIPIPIKQLLRSLITLLKLEFSIWTVVISGHHQ
ncbi:unnamed protein product [Adineta steineri]|uniref:Uncharacterized protein n=1 Tax=Adineta steineri TaxID=433720 RepID=A0A819RFY3_9BILA|nr:unnamed protein product [Adineta steineri]